MMKRIFIRRLFTRLLMLVIVTGAIALGFVTLPAHAALRQLEEAPGQTVYQSRQTLQDQHSNSWQAIAFKRIQPNGAATIYLRLVGFPGTVELDHTRPLGLTNSLGKTWTAADVSQQMFTDATHSESNIGQYDLQPILMQLEPTVPLQLDLPTLNGTETRLNIPSALIEEWRSMLLTLSSPQN